MPWRSWTGCAATHLAWLAADGQVPVPLAVPNEFLSRPRPEWFRRRVSPPAHRPPGAGPPFRWKPSAPPRHRSARRGEGDLHGVAVRRRSRLGCEQSLIFHRQGPEQEHPRQDSAHRSRPSSPLAVPMAFRGRASTRSLLRVLAGISPDPSSPSFSRYASIRPFPVRKV